MQVLVNTIHHIIVHVYIIVSYIMGLLWQFLGGDKFPKNLTSIQHTITILLQHIINT